ncbi:hypothetical protein ES703_113687 [subsurface metagenome]
MMWYAISIAFICVFFMVFFRKNIRAFIDRAYEFKYPGGEIKSKNPSQEPVDTTVSSTEDRMREFDSPVLQEQERLINEALTRVGPEKERFLVHGLAITKLSLAFEQIYSTIWGSQIYILEHLNDRRLIGALKEDIKTSFYDEAAIRWPNSFTNYSYDVYLNFLKSSNLIIEQNESLFITDFGVDFLQYLTRTGKSGSRFKPG